MSLREQRFVIKDLVLLKHDVNHLPIIKTIKVLRWILEEQWFRFPCNHIFFKNFVIKSYVNLLSYVKELITLSHAISCRAFLNSSFVLLFIKCFINFTFLSGVILFSVLFISSLIFPVFIVLRNSEFVIIYITVTVFFVTQVGLLMTGTKLLSNVRY